MLTKKEKTDQDQVAVWIGENNHIGILLPKHKAAEEDEWDKLHDEIAEIMARAIRKTK